MKGVCVLFIFLVAMPLVMGATIHGKIFDYNFKPATNSLVKINTQPSQLIVALGGVYSFIAPKGDYVVTALMKDSNGQVTYFVEENISVIADGDYVRDLVLFPSANLNELDLDPDLRRMLLPNNAFEPVVVHSVLVPVVIAIAIIFVLYLAKSIIARKAQKPAIVDDKDELDDLLAFIKKHRRVTQKDIRKEFPMSEAKISLMITDFEHQHKIKKIKKGRGNVIIYVDSK